MNAYADAKETVLITGATSVIGRELAREFAKNGHSLVIVAPVETEAIQFARQISTEFNVPVRPIARDLRRAGSAGDIFAELTASGTRVDILCNNAGLGHRGKFWDIPLDRDMAMIRLNIEAVIRMTKRFLRPMLARGQGRILNTAAVTGSEPRPLLAVYHATRAFILAWSEALTVELDGTGVTVTTLCHGPLDTELLSKTGLVDIHLPPKNPVVMSPRDVAEAAYRGLMQAERLVVPGAADHAPPLGRSLLAELAEAEHDEKMNRKVPPEDRAREPGDAGPQETEARRE